MGSGVTGNTRDFGSLVEGSKPSSPAMTEIDSLLLGRTIELILMTEDPDPIPPGSRGIVTRVLSFGDGRTQITVDWDPEVGRSLSLVVPPDQFKVVD